MRGASRRPGTNNEREHQDGSGRDRKPTRTPRRHSDSEQTMNGPQVAPRRHRERCHDPWASQTGATRGWRSQSTRSGGRRCGLKNRRPPNHEQRRGNEGLSQRTEAVGKGPRAPLDVAVAPAVRAARGRPPPPSQAVTAARRWVWTFRRLWVAAMSRHSDRQAARPRRWKRLVRRLNFSWPKTGSMVPCRVR
jgi:hypothetical protein